MFLPFCGGNCSNNARITNSHQASLENANIFRLRFVANLRNDIVHFRPAIVPVCPHVHSWRAVDVERPAGRG